MYPVTQDLEALRIPRLTEPGGHIVFDRLHVLRQLLDGGWRAALPGK